MKVKFSIAVVSAGLASCCIAICGLARPALADDPPSLTEILARGRDQEHPLRDWSRLIPDNKPHEVIKHSDMYSKCFAMACEQASGKGDFTEGTETKYGASIIGTIGFVSYTKFGYFRDLMIYINIEPKLESGKIGSRSVAFDDVALVNDRLKDMLRVGRALRDSESEESFGVKEFESVAGLKFSVYKIRGEPMPRFSIENPAKNAKVYCPLSELHYLIDGVTDIQNWFNEVGAKASAVEPAKPAPAPNLVFVNPGSKKYHNSRCRYSKGANSLSLSTAISRGLDPCKVCGG